MGRWSGRWQLIAARRVGNGDFFGRLHDATTVDNVVTEFFLGLLLRPISSTWFAVDCSSSSLPAAPDLIDHFVVFHVVNAPSDASGDIWNSLFDCIRQHYDVDSAAHSE
jgi:hypothetical protein